MLFDMEADAPLPGPIVSTALMSGGHCGSGAVELVGCASDFPFGWTACRDRCHLRDKSDESAYPDSSFQHHDCDTSAGSSGALLLCTTALGTALPIAIHAVGWSTSGRPIGSGVCNVATPLSAQMPRLLLRELRKGDD